MIDKSPLLKNLPFLPIFSQFKIIYSKNSCNQLKYRKGKSTCYNKDSLIQHPDIIIEKKSDSPNEDKSLADSKALIPVLKDFFQKHPLINSKTFLGDSAFDSINIYKYLLQEAPFEKAYIPLDNTKASIVRYPFLISPVLPSFTSANASFFFTGRLCNIGIVNDNYRMIFINLFFYKPYIVFHNGFFFMERKKIS